MTMPKKEDCMKELRKTYLTSIQKFPYAARRFNNQSQHDDKSKRPQRQTLGQTIMFRALHFSFIPFYGPVLGCVN